MKRIIILIFLGNLLFAQNTIYESGYSGIGFSFSQTKKDIPVNSIAFKRSIVSNYLVEATLNYIDKNKNIEGFNSAGLRFSKMLFKNKDQVPVSGYGHAGFEFIKFRDFYYKINFGFGLFHKFRFTMLSFVPEFFVNYSLILDSNENLLSPRQYVNKENAFILGFMLNNIFQITEWNTILIIPGIVASEDDYVYKIKVAFDFDI